MPERWPSELAATGECEGRESHADRSPATVALAKKLHRPHRKTGARKSYRSIAEQLALLGRLSDSRSAYGPSAIRQVLGIR